MTAEEYLNDPRPACACGCPGCDSRDCMDDAFEAFCAENDWRTAEEWKMLNDSLT